MIQQQNIQAQSDAQQQQVQAQAQAEMQKNQAKAQIDSQLETAKNDLKIQYLQQEVQSKKDLMLLEFELNSQLKGIEREIVSSNEAKREDRKDDRVDRQAAHQKDMINQRNKGDSLNNFESSGNDILTGGAGLDRFTP